MWAEPCPDCGEPTLDDNHCGFLRKITVNEKVLVRNEKGEWYEEDESNWW